eukprot:g6502.t1
MAATFWALFGADAFTSAGAPPSYDDTVSWITLVVAILFTLEFGAVGVVLPMMDAEGRKYFGGVYWWLDIVASASVWLDVAFVASALGLGPEGGGGGEVARTGRAARIGTRAARMVRALRLVRVLRVLKMVRKRQQRKVEEQVRRRKEEQQRAKSERPGETSKYSVPAAKPGTLPALDHLGVQMPAEKRGTDVILVDQRSKGFASMSFKDAGSLKLSAMKNSFKTGKAKAGKANRVLPEGQGASSPTAAAATPLIREDSDRRVLARAISQSYKAQKHSIDTGPGDDPVEAGHDDSSKLANRIGDATTVKVVVGVLLMMVILPLLGPAPLLASDTLTASLRQARGVVQGVDRAQIDADVSVHAAAADAAAAALAAADTSANAGAPNASTAAAAGSTGAQRAAAQVAAGWRAVWDTTAAAFVAANPHLVGAVIAGRLIAGPGVGESMAHVAASAQALRLKDKLVVCAPVDLNASATAAEFAALSPAVPRSNLAAAEQWLAPAALGAREVAAIASAEITAGLTPGSLAVESMRASSAELRQARASAAGTLAAQRALWPEEEGSSPARCSLSGWGEGSAAGWGTHALLSRRKANESQATADIGLVLFVCAMMIAASTVFNASASKLADSITAPLAAAAAQMERVACLDFANLEEEGDGGSELRPGAGQVVLAEAAMLERSKRKMLGGILSFSRYVPVPVVRRLMARTGGTPELLVQRRTITIFFSDIAGFTSICEAMQPQQLLVLLTEYFQAMSEIIHQSEGLLAEFIGDAILALWNCPDDMPQHAMAAVDATVRMWEVLEGPLDRSWQQRDFPLVRARAGLHTARVYCGNIGSLSRMK